MRHSNSSIYLGRLPRPAQIASSVAVAVLVTACEPEPDGAFAEGVVVRDSAGFTIVENHQTVVATWRLVRERLVPADTAGPVEERPLDPMAAYATADGHVVVGDGGQVGWHAVLVYDGDRRFIRKFGGSGRGPGEFGGQLWSVHPYRGDSIVAWDRRGPQGPSMKVFGFDGGYARDVTIPYLDRERPEGTNGYSVGFHGAFADGTLLTSSDGIVDVPSEAGPAWFKHFLLVVRPDGGGWDSVGDYRFSQLHWNGATTTSYFFAAQAYELPYGNDLVRGNGETYEYHILRRDGTPTRIVRRSFTREPVSAADVDEFVDIFIERSTKRQQPPPQMIEQLRRQLRANPHPDLKPAYSNLLVDHEQNVWIERFRWFDPWSVPREPEPTTWDVFDPSGSWIAELTAPSRVLLMSVSAGGVVGVRIDDVDVRQVVIYDVEHP